MKFGRYRIYTCQLFLRYFSGSAGIFEDDTIISEDSRRIPKSSEEVRSLPKTSEVCRRRSYPSPSLRTPINGSSLPVGFTSKIRDREEGIVIYSFSHGFRSPVTWVWVNIFLEIVSSKTATTHIFQSGVRVGRYKNTRHAVTSAGQSHTRLPKYQETSSCFSLCCFVIYVYIFVLDKTAGFVCHHLI